MNRIKGKVASILNEREVVLNVGENQGVQVGMQFSILYPDGIEIPDPDNPDTIIDSIEWPKTQVKVVQTYPKLSVARTFRTITIPEQGYNVLAGMASAMSYKPEKTVVETLRTEGTFADKEIKATDSIVKVGDPVVQLSAPLRAIEE